MGDRNSHVKQVLGSKTLGKVSASRVLMVGAGGIGCELLKNLVLSGFKEIEVVDLDTIDLSNLNRQFLFQKKHIKKPKAIVARETALQFNPNVNIKAYHESIYDAQFDVAWFKSFDLVMNALDNLAARQHVNMMCIAADVPLIESGTAGYLGQVSVHKKDETMCYACIPKPSTRKTYPVCTIRSTPSEPIHCIVWAKSYLFPHLFGEEQAEDLQETVTEDNAKEIKELKQEAAALKALRDKMGQADHTNVVFSKVFLKDVQRLLQMDDLWKSRKKPTPLDYKDFQNVEMMKAPEQNLDWDQKPWSLMENVRVFRESLAEISADFNERRKTDPGFSMSFDKDDEASLNFVTAAANLRAHIFGISVQSRFSVKEMAGNIIPAIATTNAIVAGMIVMLAFKVLSDQLGQCKYTYLSWGGGRTHLLMNTSLEKPSPFCSVCSNTYLVLKMNTQTKTLGFLLDKVIMASGKGLGLEGEITIEEGGRLLYDVEFDDNLESPLSTLKINAGSRISVTNDNDDEPDKNYSILLMIEQVEIEGFEIQGSREFKKRVAPPPVEAPAPVAVGKRKADDANIDDLNSAKKAKTDAIIIDDDTVII